MGTILISWELGGGLGHLVQLAPLARGLAARGHKVFAALRHLERADAVFGNGVASLLAAPWATTPVERQVRPPLTLAHILHNMGWHDPAQLRGLCEAWRTLYALVRPDLIVFDHAPTALLASRGLDVRRVTIGSGFCIPPDVSPLPNLRPWAGGANAEPARLAESERGLLGCMNAQLGEWGQPALARVTQLYSEVDEAFLVTFPELDHYLGRASAGYWGPIYSSDGGGKCDWPDGRGGRVFGYLKNFSAVGALLEALARSGRPAVVVADGIPGGVRGRFAGCGTMRFEDRPVDIGAAARECDLAVLNAGHGATAAALLAGKPVLLVPVHLEQGLLARAAVRNTGAGLEASYKDGADAAAKLEAMLATEKYAEAARAFAARYAGFDPAAQAGRMVGRVEELLEGAGRRPRTSAAARSRAGVFSG
jgi:hypothetical protein